MSKKKKEKTIKVSSLSEFLKARGFEGETPYRWARCFYKYTDCGPWTSFLVKAAQTEETQDVYYEDIGKAKRVRKEVPCECCLKEGGTHPDDPAETMYAKCEPDPQCRDCRGRGTYVTDVRTKETHEVTDENCVGIKIGSIVEGSDMDVGPWEFEFPFEYREFSDAVLQMEKETSFYWERDNSHWFHLRRISDSGDQYSCHRAWDDVVWDSDKPRNRKLRDAVNDYTSDPDKWHGSNSEACGTTLSPQRYEYLPLPGMPDWEIAEYTNDGIFY